MEGFKLFNRSASIKGNNLFSIPSLARKGWLETEMYRQKHFRLSPAPSKVFIYRFDYLFSDNGINTPSYMLI